MINNNLQKVEIDDIINKAYIYLVIGEREKGLDLMVRLKGAYPGDNNIEKAYRLFEKASRDAVIEQNTGFY